MKDETGFEQVIGYAFQNRDLLEQALTHSSYAHEKKLPPLSDNERLEFLGDAVLELISSDFLYHHDKDLPEGALSKRRAALVCEPTLAYCADEIKLGDFVRLGKGEDASGGRRRKSILSDAFEALIGAIYLDGGIEPAKEFVCRFVLTDIEERIKFSDSKTYLQELIQGQGKSTPEYKLVGEEGPDHAKVFFAEVYSEGRRIGSGSGPSKKAAEQAAAAKGIEYVSEKH